MAVTVHPPDLKEFFETVFDGMSDGEHILLARQTKLEGRFLNAPWDGKACSIVMKFLGPYTNPFNICGIVL